MTEANESAHGEWGGVPGSARLGVGVAGGLLLFLVVFPLFLPTPELGQIDKVLSLSGLLFFVGLVGFVVRRNLIVMLICLELMFNAVNLNMMAFSHELNDWTGQMFTLFVVSIAACEAAIGLAIIISLYRHVNGVDVDDLDLLSG